MAGIRRKAALASLVLSGLLAVACSSNAPATTQAVDAFVPVGAQSGDLTMVRDLDPPVNVRNGHAEALSPNDLLLIDFFQLKELDRKMRIDSRGMITLPLIGSVRAGGRSTVQLEKELERRFGETYLQSPEISVLQIETGERIAFGGGEFVQPGRIILSGNPTLSRAIAKAGGLNDVADPEKIFVYREQANGRQVANYSLTAIHAAQAPDPLIYRNDIIVAFKSKQRVAFNHLKDAMGIAANARRSVQPF